MHKHRENEVLQMTVFKATACLPSTHEPIWRAMESSSYTKYRHWKPYNLISVPCPLAILTLFFCFNSIFSYFYKPASYSYRKEPCKQQREADDIREKVKLPNEVEIKHLENSDLFPLNSRS